jgi:hypothetical protein
MLRVRNEYLPEELVLWNILESSDRVFDQSDDESIAQE